MPNHTPPLLARWRFLRRLPGGRWLFARLLGLFVPYSGTIRPRVHELDRGRALVSIRERRRIRNHLDSIHAVALANLGELSSGLAMTLAFPEGVRGIPVRMEIDYHKKARGTITAEGRAAPPPAIPQEIEDPATATLTDETGEVVAEVTVTWRLGPKEGARERGAVSLEPERASEH